jgi:hypothetical protein
MKYEVHLTFEGDPALAAQWAWFAKKKARELGQACARYGIGYRINWIPINEEITVRVRWANGIQYAHIIASSLHGIAIFPRTSSFLLGWGAPYTDGDGEPINPPIGTYGGNWPDIIIQHATKVVRGPSYAGQLGIGPSDNLGYGNINWNYLTYDKGGGYANMLQRHNGDFGMSAYHGWYYENGKTVFPGIVTRVRGIGKHRGHTVIIGTKSDGNWCVAASRTPSDFDSWYVVLNFSRAGLSGGAFNLTREFLFSADGGKAICVQENASNQTVIEIITLDMDPESGSLLGSLTTQNLGVNRITLPGRTNNTANVGIFGYESSATSTKLSFGYDWIVPSWAGTVGTGTLENSRDDAVLAAVAALDGGIWEYVSKTVSLDLGNDSGITYEVTIRQAADPETTNAVFVQTGHAQGWEVHATWSLSDGPTGELGGMQVLGADFIKKHFTDDQGNYINVPAIAVLAPSPASVYIESRNSTCSFDSVPTYTESNYTNNPGGEYANGHSESSTSHSVSFERHVILDLVVLADPGNSGTFDVEIFRAEAGTILDDLGSGISDISLWVDDQTDNSPLARTTTKTRTVSIGTYKKSTNRVMVTEMNIAEGAFVVHNVVSSFTLSGANSTQSESGGTVSTDFPDYRMAWRSSTDANIEDPFGTPLIPYRSTWTGTETDGATDGEMPDYSTGYTKQTTESLIFLRASYASKGQNVSKVITPAGGDDTHAEVDSSPNFIGTVLGSFVDNYSGQVHNSLSGVSMQVLKDHAAILYTTSFWGYSEYGPEWTDQSIYLEPLRNDDRELTDYQAFDIRDIHGTPVATSQKLKPSRFGIV